MLALCCIHRGGGGVGDTICPFKHVRVGTLPFISMKPRTQTATLYEFHGGMPQEHSAAVRVVEAF